jgi:hypothetical protein
MIAKQKKSSLKSISMKKKSNLVLVYKTLVLVQDYKGKTHITGKTERRSPWEKRYGKPTVDSLEKWRKDFKQSMLPGEINEHISKQETGPSDCWIEDQATKKVIAYYKAPMFEVI